MKKTETELNREARMKKAFRLLSDDDAFNELVYKRFKTIDVDIDLR